MTGSIAKNFSLQSKITVQVTLYFSAISIVLFLRESRKVKFGVILIDGNRCMAHWLVI